MNTKHKLVITLLTTVLILSGCQALGIDSGSQVGQLVEEVMGRFGRKDEERLAASGTIRATEVRVASELGGRLVSVAVKQGDLVQAGDVLARLDDTELATRLLEAEAAVVVARADLAVTRVGARREEIMAMEAMLALAEADRDGALATWENAVDAVQNPQALDAQIAEARTRVKLAEQAIALAEAELAKQKLIRDQKSKGTVARDIADWQVTAGEENLAAARADLDTAQTLLNGLWGIRNEPLGLLAQANAARGQYEIARSGVAVAQAELDDLLAGPTGEDVALAEAAVRLEEAKAGVIRSQQEKLVLTSPIDGVVLEQALHEGELAAPAATVFGIADLGRLELVVYVPVNQLGYVQLGQAVEVGVDSFPGRVFAGTVTRIGDQPEYTPRNVATKEERLNTFYAVEIRLDNEQGLLKPGMPADAVFQ